jgi:hypothetical protein
MLKIYKIIDNTNGNIYIGKTKRKYLCERLAQHKYRQSCMSREIIKNGDYKIELIEETHDDSRERYWIEHTECVNKQIPGRTKKEWTNDNREHLNQLAREWYKNNKDKQKDMRHKYDERKYNWYSSMAGSPYKNNMSLLKIDPNLFLY